MTARERSYNEFDAEKMADAFSRPGIDPREWVSYGIVDPDGEADDDKSVEIDPDYGPLVNITLPPSGKQVRARVAASMAGNGEGEWFPFIEKDEVLVAIAGGNERNCVIIGRLSQGIDGFPSLVGGVDTSKNAVAFRRSRTPYVWELAEGPFFLTCTKNNASLLLDKAGQWYLKDGEGSTLFLGTDWLGFQDKSGANLLQLQLTAKRFFLSVDGGGATMALCAGDPSYIIVGSSLNIGTAGATPFWHATSIESVCVLLDAFMRALGTVLTAITPPIPLTTNALGDLLLIAGQTSLPLAIPMAAALPLALNAVPLAAAMSAPALPAVGPAGVPGLAAAGLVIG